MPGSSSIMLLTSDTTVNLTFVPIFVLLVVLLNTQKLVVLGQAFTPETLKSSYQLNALKMGMSWGPVKTHAVWRPAPKGVIMERS